MYESAQNEEYEQFKYQARLAGLDLDKAKEDLDFERAMSDIDPTKKTDSQSLPIFKDPSEYAHLSKEEREELTRDMMRKHKMWAGQSALDESSHKSKRPNS